MKTSPYIGKYLKGVLQKKMRVDFSKGNDVGLGL